MALPKEIAALIETFAANPKAPLDPLSRDWS
jgi:hypothetical protein